VGFSVQQHSTVVMYSKAEIKIILNEGLCIVNELQI
jgi:hypothetical protein